MSLRDDLIDALAPVADQLAERVPGEPVEELAVRHSHVRQATECPAAAALDGETPFEATPALVSWELAAQAADLLVHGHRDPQRAGGPTTPAGALALATEEVTDNWAFDWWASAGEAERSVAEAAAVRRLSALARMASSWPPEGPVTVGHRPSWRFPNRALVLKGRVDLVIGRRGDGHTLVVVLGGDHRAEVTRRAAFEAVVEAAALNRPPAWVLMALPDAGWKRPVRVDDALLRDGVAVAAEAASVALAAVRRDATGLDRRPGARCRRCVHSANCPPGGKWLANTGRVRLGFLPPR